jgi:hypothetical protein
MSILKVALIVICVIGIVSAQYDATNTSSVQITAQPDQTTTVQYQQTTSQPIYGQQLFPQTTVSPIPSQQNSSFPLPPQYQYNTNQSYQPGNSPQLFQFVGMILPYEQTRLQPQAQSLFWNVQSQPYAPSTRPNRFGPPTNYGNQTNFTSIWNISSKNQF